MEGTVGKPPPAPPKEGWLRPVLRLRFTLRLQMNVGKRIEYIDAMRGMTMILVVYSHICAYCLGSRHIGFNDVFFLFRLPCFFFISGWLFYKAERVWDAPTIKAVVKKKFMVQIVPTVIFLLLLAPPPLFFTRLGAVKGGYWFTFALFEFFVLYILSVRFCRKGSLIIAILISIAAFCYDVLYNRYFASMGLLTKALGFLSFMTWRYYLFFFLGTLAKRHFDAFLCWTSRWWVIVLVVAGFTGIALFPHTDTVPVAYLKFALGGILGMTMVFCFFRANASLFSKEHAIGRCLQYVGTRTLDIYLLHYFFLPRFLLPWGQQLQTHDNPFLELAVALLLALVVTSLCLLVSRIIRLSPFLARYLFGVTSIT